VSRETAVVTLPAEGYENVARLVVGGVASRLDFGFETVDDLQLAVEFVLRTLPSRSGSVCLRLVEDGRSLAIEIGPVGRLSLDEPLHPLDGARVELGASLRRLVDSVTLAGDGADRVVVLEKTLPAPLV
jgi:hypothetical protein